MILTAAGNIIIGITGGIAAYKACDLIRLFVKDKFRVHPVMTKAATEFITPLTVSCLSTNKAVVDIFDSRIERNVGHIELADIADLMLVAPATADIIAKIASGIADDPVSLIAMAFYGTGEKPLVIAPAMNYRMYNHPATKNNLEILKKRGVIIIDPEEGELACGESGEGRLASVDVIYNAVIKCLDETRDMKNINAIVTAGGTEEPIDPVRVIANRSSGKMGYAVAKQLKKRGAKVTLISSVDLPDPGVDEIAKFKTASDLKEMLDSKFPSCDLLVMAAAVADFKPKKQSDNKLHRSDGGITIELEPTEDIIANLAENKGDRFIVGFAAESEDMISRAKSKLKSKKLDMIIANDISRSDIGFNSEHNEVVILNKNGEKQIKRDLKINIAKGIVDEIASMILKK